MSTSNHFPADAFHPHYPSKDGDHFERLMDGAKRMACTSLLMCRTYTEAEIQAALSERARRPDVRPSKEGK